MNVVTVTLLRLKYSPKYSICGYNESLKKVLICKQLMRVNETLSSSGDYMKGIDFQQVFGIFDPEQGLYFNKREGVDVGRIQQRRDINSITHDTGMLEGFWLLVQTSVQFLKLQ